MKEMIPRIVIAGVSSNVGKTTLVLSLVQLLNEQGLKVRTFKCGPDYLDPIYHKKVSKVDSINLDSWMMGKEGVLKTFQDCCVGFDIALIEGVMGLYDGVGPLTNEGSTAEIAMILDAPIILLIDASGMARSVAAIFEGFKKFDQRIRIAGAIFNYIGSLRHLEILEEAVDKKNSLGGIVKGERNFILESRNLGLKTVLKDEISNEIFYYWKEHCRKYLDLKKIIAIAKDVTSKSKMKNNLGKEDVKAKKINLLQRKVKIAYAWDEAFHFYYPENLNSLKENGAELIPFSPIYDKNLPDNAQFIYLGGGYPELYAEKLASNSSMLDSIRSFAKSGKPIYGECGGLIYLAKEVTLITGESFSMLDLLELKVDVKDKLKALGYTTVELLEDSFLGSKGNMVKGHQFRYSDCIETSLDNKSQFKMMKLTKRRGNIISNEGFKKRNVIGTYVHSHFASNPKIPESIIHWINNTL